MNTDLETSTFCFDRTHLELNLLWLHFHTTARQFVGKKSGSQVFVWCPYVHYISVHDTYTCCGTSQCWNAHSGQNSTRTCHGQFSHQYLLFFPSYFMSRMLWFITEIWFRIFRVGILDYLYEFFPLLLWSRFDSLTWRLIKTWFKVNSLSSALRTPVLWFSSVGLENKKVFIFTLQHLVIWDNSGNNQYEVLALKVYRLANSIV